MRSNNKIKTSTIQPSFKQTSTGKFILKILLNSSNRYTRVKLTKSSLIKGISTLSFFKNRLSCKIGKGKEKACSGSMTVEAAIVLPFFLFFFFNILWIIEIYKLHSTLLFSLQEVGRELSVYAYAYDKIVQEEEDSGLEAFIENAAFSWLYVKERVEEQAGVDYLDTSPLVGGSQGISYLDSSILQQNDIIDLTASYVVSPFIRIAGFYPAAFYSRYYGRAWTGYDVEKGAEEETEVIYVYVAENARVYHLDRSCSHITLSIRQVALDEAEEIKNQHGEKYTPCEICITDKKGSIYITLTGNRYHQRLECSGLKRTIMVIPRLEAEKHYKMCQRCGR